MKKLLQKIIAKFFNSFLVRKNPFIIDDVGERINLFSIIKAQKKIQANRQIVILGENSELFHETTIHNSVNDKSKIIIGENCQVRAELLIQKYGGKIEIGNNCFIGPGTRIWSGEKIIIGNNVLISHNCNIVDTNSHEINAEERSERYIDLINNGPWASKGSIITSPIYIEDNVWISFNVTILKGVRVGCGTIISANTVVTKDVPANCIIAGNPFRIIRFLK